MKITKFVHSCLLVESNDRTVLFDPGIYSWEAGLFAVDQLQRLDAVVITHEHEDHLYQPFVEALTKKFPETEFVTTSAATKQLKDMAIKNISTESTDLIKIFSKQSHAPNQPFKASPAENIAVHMEDRLTVGGDRHDLEETKEILALPVTAPWGSESEAAQMLLRLNPKRVIPIHDWHWNEDARKKEYSRFEDLCSKNGIGFLWPTDGEPIEV